jgi:hypothetical protein
VKEIPLDYQNTFFLKMRDRRVKQVFSRGEWKAIRKG